VKTPKQRCENCPARNNRVMLYTAREGTYGGLKILCLECAAILNRICREEADRNTA
jgi:hypothetical protein